MKINKIKSIFHLGVRQKVLLVLMGVLMTSLTISGWFALQKEKEDTLSEVNQRGTKLSKFLAKSLAFSVVGYDYHTLDLLLQEITSSDDIPYVKVTNLKGNKMAESGSISDNVEKDIVLFSESILLGEEVVGSLKLGYSTKRILQNLETQKYALIKREALIILLIAIGEFFALSFIIIRPVSSMSKSLDNRELESGVFLGSIPVISNDEFGHLAIKFNDLSKDLNYANSELRSRVDYADAQLLNNNFQLKRQSDELKKINEEFRKLSITDSLTGLYNRRHFEEKLEAEIKLSKRYGDINSLMVIDIDFFKRVNDTYGHVHGDTVLKEVASFMQSRQRETDLLCRVGGEEFVALCKRADKKTIIKIADKLRRDLSEHKIYLGKDEISVTISIGVATITPENVSVVADNFYRFADIAVYHSKENGRNRVTHYDNMSDQYTAPHKTNVG